MEHVRGISEAEQLAGQVFETEGIKQTIVLPGGSGFPFFIFEAG